MNFPLKNTLVSLAKGERLTCNHCKKEVKKSTLERNLYICPHCKKYFKMPAIQRIQSILDEYTVLSQNPTIINPINFPGYEEKQEEMINSPAPIEAFLSAVGKIRDAKVVVCAMDSYYLMGSMGSYVGEEICRSFAYATQNKLPLIMFCASGGARMQEGIYSLMQMAKTTMAVSEHDKSNLLYLSCMTNPTTGGVLASFASIADIVIAEPDAHIGFAGPRVIQQTINQDLPKGFQSSQFSLEHGFLDDIIPRYELKQYLYHILKIHKYSFKHQKIS